MCVPVSSWCDLVFVCFRDRMSVRQLNLHGNDGFSRTASSGSNVSITRSDPRHSPTPRLSDDPARAAPSEIADSPGQVDFVKVTQPLAPSLADTSGGECAGETSAPVAIGQASEMSASQAKEGSREASRELGNRDCDYVVEPLCSSSVLVAKDRSGAEGAGPQQPTHPAATAPSPLPDAPLAAYEAEGAGRESQEGRQRGAGSSETAVPLDVLPRPLSPREEQPAAAAPSAAATEMPARAGDEAVAAATRGGGDEAVAVVAELVEVAEVDAAQGAPSADDSGCVAATDGGKESNLSEAGRGMMLLLCFSVWERQRARVCSHARARRSGCCIIFLTPWRRYVSCFYAAEVDGGGSRVGSEVEGEVKTVGGARGGDCGGDAAQEESAVLRVRKDLDACLAILEPDVAVACASQALESGGDERRRVEMRGDESEGGDETRDDEVRDDDVGVTHNVVGALMRERESTDESSMVRETSAHDAACERDFDSADQAAAAELRKRSFTHFRAVIPPMDQEEDVVAVKDEEIVDDDTELTGVADVISSDEDDGFEEVAEDVLLTDAAGVQTDEEIATGSVGEEDCPYSDDDGFEKEHQGSAEE